MEFDIELFSLRLRQGPGAQMELAIELFSLANAPTAWEASSRLELAAQFLTGAGLEVGALQRRLPLPNHCSVTLVDRLPLEELLAHYPELPRLPIQAPDLINDGETLSKVASDSMDFVIANHLLEQYKNPIQTIANFLRTLKVGGILFMAVPDRRFTFDIDRPVTPYPVLAETFREGRRRNRESLYREWADHVAGAHRRRRLTRSPESCSRSGTVSTSMSGRSRTCSSSYRAAAGSSGCRSGSNRITCTENEVIVILRKHHDAVAGSPSTYAHLDAGFCVNHGLGHAFDTPRPELAVIDCGISFRTEPRRTSCGWNARAHDSRASPAFRGSTSPGATGRPALNYVGFLGRLPRDDNPSAAATVTTPQQCPSGNWLREIKASRRASRSCIAESGPYAEWLQHHERAGLFWPEARGRGAGCIGCDSCRQSRSSSRPTTRISITSTGALSPSALNAILAGSCALPTMHLPIPECGPI